mmetsp:Transcript_130271/g.324824  ORF Transcript_130271/g.324824 Transcript_130271/m.324824 type:complete len:304 (-) Transcript_130271:326-1237(-)
MHPPHTKGASELVKLRIRGGIHLRPRTMLQQACLIVIAPAGKLLAVAGKRMAASAVETIVVEELLLEVTELLDAALFAHNALAKPQAQAMPAQLIAIVTWPPAACRCLCRWRELLPQRWRSRRPNHAMLQQTCCLLSGPAASFWLQHNSGHCRLVALAHAACRTIAVEDCPDIVEASRAPLEATGGAQYIVAQTLGPAQTLAILTRLDTRDDARAIPAVACGLDTHRDSAAEWRRCGECEVCPEAHAATRAAAIEGREGVVVDLAPGHGLEVGIARWGPRHARHHCLERGRGVHSCKRCIRAL